jgi:hypothetical protein
MLEQIRIDNPSKEQEARSCVNFKTRDSWQITTGLFLKIESCEVEIQTLGGLIGELYLRERVGHG